LVVGLGVLLAVSGPFGTFLAAPLWERLGYWIAVTLLAYGVYRQAFRLADRITMQGGRVQLGGRIVALLVTSAPLTLPIWLASYRHTPRLWPHLKDLADLYPSVLVVGGAILALQSVGERIGASALPSPHAGAPEHIDEPAAAGETNAGAAFLDRLPPHLGRDLIALEMEDHYVRAHTTLGSVLLLMRMRDAVAELRGVDGIQVHRSWWVARKSIRAVEGTSRALRLELANGLVVPVARDRRDLLANLDRPAG
jgi:hypothetical protein